MDRTKNVTIITLPEPTLETLAATRAQAYDNEYFRFIAPSQEIRAGD